MRNPFRRDCPAEVIAGLMALAGGSRSRAAYEYLQSMVLYASVGRDRRKLDVSFVDRTRERMSKLDEMFPA